MTNTQVAVEGMGRFCTLRKFIVLVIALIVLKSTWTWIHYRLVDQPLDIGSAELNDDYLFKPRSCVMEDGVCKPFSEAKNPVPIKGLTAHGDSFYFNGLPFRILSGSFHYFRTHPGQWGDRLMKMRAAGLNTVMTYIPWNLHEKTKGVFNFNDPWNLLSFIQLAQKVGLYVIARPGPFICAEWEFGGFPSWLLSDPHMKVRTSAYKPYLDHVQSYFSKLLPLLSSVMYKRGGPVIAFQVENEFGSYSYDPKYLEFLLKEFHKYGLDEELLFTSDGAEQLPNGTYPGILATVNFVKKPVEHLLALKTFQPNKPMMVTEFWSGWFDHWGEEHHQFDPETLRKSLNIILGMNASVNFYMFVGGTNFQFWNGANNGSDGYAPTVTSYDYDAAISENGEMMPKYFVIQQVIKQMELGPHDWLEQPSQPLKANYGPVNMKEVLTFDEMVKLVIEKPIKHLHPLPMEYLDINNGGGQGYGWILYRTTFTSGNKLSFEGSIFDLALVMINGKALAVMDWASGLPAVIKIPSAYLKNGSNRLEILVENCGRVNFKAKENDLTMLIRQRKGILGNVLLDRQTLIDWEHTSIEFCEPFRQMVQTSPMWQQFTPQKKPALYRGNFIIKNQPQDTFLNMENWTKGLAMVNGFIIGRYWNIGPQGTLYVPAPLLLQGRNEIMIFELDKPHENIELTDQAVL